MRRIVNNSKKSWIMNMNNDTPSFFHCLSYNTLFAHEHLYKYTPVSTLPQNKIWKVDEQLQSLCPTVIFTSHVRWQAHQFGIFMPVHSVTDKHSLQSWRGQDQNPKHLCAFLTCAGKCAFRHTYNGNFTPWLVDVPWTGLFYNVPHLVVLIPVYVYTYIYMHIYLFRLAILSYQ